MSAFSILVSAFKACFLHGGRIAEGASEQNVEGPEDEGVGRERVILIPTEEFQQWPLEHYGYDDNGSWN